MKSAYHIEMTRRNQMHGESSKAKGIHDFWKSLWNMNIPPTLKTFAWKMCNNLLPIKENLFHRHILSNSHCSFCFEHLETTFHILWTNPSSVVVWQESSRQTHKLSLMELDGLGLLQQLQEKLEVKEFEEALTTLRLIWLRRNSYVFGCVFTPPCQLITKAREVMADFHVALARTEKDVGNHAPILPRST